MLVCNFVWDNLQSVRDSRRIPERVMEDEAGKESLIHFTSLQKGRGKENQGGSGLD